MSITVSYGHLARGLSIISVAIPMADALDFIGDTDVTTA